MDSVKDADMPVRMVSAKGKNALNLATTLLQRARQTSPVGGLYEAADMQWAWRKPRRTDEVDQCFWIDDEGPVAAILVTSWTDDLWQFVPAIVPGLTAPTAEVVWEATAGLIAEYAPATFQIPVREDDEVFQDFAKRSGLVASGRDHTGWIEATDIPAQAVLPEGFCLVDRSRRRHLPHPMRHRNGESVGERLAECSLYDPELDLSVEANDGTSAGYSLYWYDPATGVGLVEPVRVEDAFQRRGLARAMVTAGLNRLARKGATRMKVSWESEAAGRLYQGLGFKAESSTIWYQGTTIRSE